MFNFNYLVLLLFTRFILISSSEEDCARTYLQYLNNKLGVTKSMREQAKWKFFTNMSSENLDFLDSLEVEIFGTEIMDRKKLMKFPWDNITDLDLKRQFKLFKNMKQHILPHNELVEYCQIRNVLLQSYGMITIPSFHDPNENITLTEVKDHIAKILSPAELKHYWIELRQILKPWYKEKFKIYIELLDRAAKLNGFENIVHSVTENYEIENYFNLVTEIYQSIKPLYVQLHAYVRYRLKLIYQAYISEKGPIPMHLIGEVNAGSWQWLTKFTRPYEDRPHIYPDCLKNTSMDRLELYKLANDFYVSLNLTSVSDEVWQNSIFKRRANTNAFCYMTVFKFLKKGKFRVLDCESAEDLTSFPTALKAVATIQKYTECEKQPFIYQKSVLGVTDHALQLLFTLSTTTMSYITKISNIRWDSSKEDTFNNLWFKGLKLIPSISHLHAVLLWRVGIYAKEVAFENCNCNWWKNVVEFQGVEPPVDRSENNFDMGLLMKVIVGQPVTDIYLGTVLAYQLYRVFCLKTGQYEKGNPEKPLHECNLYGKPEVGNLIAEGLHYGRAKHWSYILEVVTGENRLDASAILEYYQPIMEWLIEQNKENQVFVGWGAPSKICRMNGGEDRSSSMET